MRILFQAKFLILTFITLIVSAASSNEILIYTEPNKYELFRINEDSYRLSFKDSNKYYRYDSTEIRLLLDKVCQENNFSSVNTISKVMRNRDNYDYDKGKYLEIYISCKKKVDPVELAKKLKQKEADRLVKSETPSHCSELYGCQNPNPSELKPSDQDNNDVTQNYNDEVQSNSHCSELYGCQDPNPPELKPSSEDSKEIKLKGKGFSKENIQVHTDNCYKAAKANVSKPQAKIYCKCYTSKVIENFNADEYIAVMKSLPPQKLGLPSPILKNETLAMIVIYCSALIGIELTF